MKRVPDAVFWTAAAGMELSWVYAWAAFIMDAVTKRPYPLTEAVAIFVLAALVTVFTRGRGWRNIQILSIHGAGLTAFAFRGVHQLWYRPESFWSLTWLGDFLGRTRDPIAWFTLAALWAWMIVFWICGMRYVRRSAAYPEISVRFDKGLTWLFALLIMKLFMRTQIGIPSAEPVSEAQIFPFFIFGLLAVALARNRSGSQKGFMTGYRGIGLIISFSAAVFFCGTGLVLLFMPYLRAASEIGYEVLKESGKVLGPILVKILMFIFGYKSNQPAMPEIIPRKSPAEPLPEIEPAWWTELFLNSMYGFFGCCWCCWSFSWSDSGHGICGAGFLQERRKQRTTAGTPTVSCNGWNTGSSICNWFMISCAGGKRDTRRSVFTGHF
ncbi:MAG: hypothetical protein P1P89_08740 [Desulfobacterales bacterium]|nr:hypothetical protein [Desulfobacterales bacterium]